MAATLSTHSSTHRQSTAGRRQARRIVRQSQTHAGYCSKTTESAAEFTDCELGQKGVFGSLPAAVWSKEGDAALRACLDHCSRCARCRFVSFSQQWKDCSWYHTCNTSSLQRDVPNFQTYQMPPGALKVNGTARPRRAKATSRRSRQALLIGGRGGGQGRFDGSNSSSRWAWYQPTAAMRLAVLLVGKVGTLQDPPSWVPADGADQTVVQLAYHMLRQNLLEANPGCQSDLFVYTWNPGLGPYIDKLYRPAWSSHQPERRGIGKALSFSAALAAALRAKRSSEQRKGTTYDLVLAMRIDALLLAPLVLSNLPRAQLWFPSQCCRPDPGAEGLSRALEAGYEHTKHECTGEGLICDVCTTSRYLRMVGTDNDKDMAAEAEYNYFVNDWLVAAPSATADTFVAVYEQHSAYLAALKEVGIGTPWMHFVWAAHVHHALRVAAGVRACVEAGRELVLVRDASKGRYCRTSVNIAHSALPHVRGPVWGGMTHALCPERGRVSCPWNSHRCATTAIEGPRQALF
jgi:hypothetical protein